MTRSASLLAFFFLASFLMVPAGVARAGSCPVCTASSECTSFDDGGVAFCVLHAAPVGCGSMTMLCCPGQGCNTASGRPSCEGTTCTVVEDLVDAGVPGTDAGMPDTDAGTSATDGGTAPSDSGGAGVDAGGTPGTDAGGGGMDAGGTPAPATSGCGCRAASSGGAGLGLVTIAAALAGLARRRL